MEVSKIDPFCTFLFTKRLNNEGLRCIKENKTKVKYKISRKTVKSLRHENVRLARRQLKQQDYQARFKTHGGHKLSCRNRTGGGGGGGGYLVAVISNKLQQTEGIWGSAHLQIQIPGQLAPLVHDVWEKTRRQISSKLLHILNVLEAAANEVKVMHWEEHFSVDFHFFSFLSSRGCPETPHTPQAMILESEK